MGLTVGTYTLPGSLSRSLWVTTAMTLTLIAGQEYRTEEEQIRALLAPLQNRQVNLEDRDALVTKLRTGRHSDVALAALALALLPKDRVPLGDLQEAAIHGDDLVASFSAWALRYQQDRTWTTAGVMRLQQFQDPEAKLRFGADLARSGRFEGWSDVVAALQDPRAQPKVFSAALRALEGYVGAMNDPEGRPVNVRSRLEQMLPSIPEERREQVQTLVRFFRSSRFSKDLTDPHWQ